MSYPDHHGDPCKPLTPEQLLRLNRRQAKLRNEGREDEWREWGSHTWQ